MTSAEVIEAWPFDGSTVGRDVDMEGLTCGPDQCSSSLFARCEHNYIYQVNLDSGEVTHEWDLTDIVNVDVTDKGIEALTYASTTGYFYAGIQNTAMIHVVELAVEDIGPPVVVPEEGEEVNNEVEEGEANTEEGAGGQPEELVKAVEGVDAEAIASSGSTFVTSFVTFLVVILAGVL